MGRDQLLGGLLEHNRQAGLSTAIWGDGALEAAQQAAASHGQAPAQADTGSTVLRLPTPLDLGYRVDCNAPERLHFPEQGGARGLLASPLELEVARLESATVREWLGYHLIEEGGKVVVDASTAYWPLQGMAFAPVVPAQRREELAMGFVVCDDLDTTNFCHFICDLLPKISVAGEVRQGIPLVIEPPKQAFQRELLERVAARHGHPLVPLEPGLELVVRELFYLRRTQHSHPLLRCSGWAMNWVRDLVGARPVHPPAGSVLYLGRRSRRRVLEEDSLMAALQRHTPRLTVVHSLGDLSVRQQAELVCSHELVIGPHGAGFTHLLFKQEGPKRAVELMAEGNGSLTFALLSGRLGIEHAIAIGEAVTTDNGPNYPDLRIAPEAVVELAWAGIGTA